MDIDDELIITILSWYPFPVYRRLAIGLELPVNRYEGSIFDPIRPSTLTIAGIFNGVTLHEEKDVGKFKPNGDIVLVGSSYEESWLDGYAPRPQTESGKPKRGRKPKPRDRKRAPRGNGKYFSSQITFVIRSRILAGKLYKVKLFRTGVFQVPGVLSATMDDLKQPLETLRSYLETKFVSVTISGLIPQMRNCKTILSDPSLKIHTEALGKALIEAKANDNNPKNMADIKYITDKSSARAVIKFSRPVPENKKKQFTLKVLTQKINYEGGLHLDDIISTHDWFNDFVLANYRTVIIDPNMSQDEPEGEEDLPMNTAPIPIDDELPFY